MEAVLTELETALGHSFERPELLVRALTHRSLANERAASEQTPASGKAETVKSEDNERLEFLGDAVLGLVVAETLFLLHPATAKTREASGAKAPCSPMPWRQCSAHFFWTAA